MLQRGVNLGRRPPKLLQDFLIGMGCRCLNFHHFINKAGKFCPFRAAEDELTFLKMFISVVEHIKHASAGNVSHNLRLLLVGEIGKFLLRFLKTAKQVRIMLAYQSLEQFFFAFVIAIKGSGSHSHGFHNIPQGSVFVPFF